MILEDPIPPEFNLSETDKNKILNLKDKERYNTSNGLFIIEKNQNSYVVYYNNTMVTIPDYKNLIFYLTH